MDDDNGLTDVITKWLCRSIIVINSIHRVSKR